jgi:hypothetical protein
MKTRLLRPGFFDNPALGKLDPSARLVFAGLWCYADREGRFKWEPERIRVKILPYDDGCDIDNLLGGLASSGLIVQYSVNGEQYGEVCKFSDHQTPHRREAQSKLPECPGTVQGQSKDSPRHPVLVTGTVLVNTLCSSSTEAAQLLKDLLLEEKPNAKIPKEIIEGKRSWAAEIDRMIRIDKRDPPEILKMIKWLYTKNLENEIQFVVQSAQSLRKKYDRIETQMKKHEPKRAEDPHKDVKCARCQSWWSTMERNEEGLCENCQRETLP